MNSFIINQIKWAGPRIIKVQSINIKIGLQIGYKEGILLELKGDLVDMCITSLAS